MKRVYSFEEGSMGMRAILGGKGCDLAEMTNMKLPVPPGFVITAQVCNEYNALGKKIPEGLEEEVKAHLKKLEEKAGRKFGDAENPLLVSVRSGAAISMPGMMDTILNLGLNEKTISGLIRMGNERFAYDAYRRFMQMFSNVVLDVKHKKFEHILGEHKRRLGVKLDTELDAGALKEIVKEYRELVRREKGIDFPEEPWKQLMMSIEAVFDSWNNPRAITYRKINKIPDDLGTAVNIQVMVFGNIGENSGTGVAFTRDPSTGENKLYGEYLMNAQGEDVVAGIRTPKHIGEMKGELPKAHEELARICKTLESHFRDMQDVEFTIEKGKLWMLQTRRGKRTAAAAIKIAVDMVSEGMIGKEEAVLRVAPLQLDRLLHRQIDPKAKVQPIAKGLPASPGAASGALAFSADDAEKRGKACEKVILVATETTPDDIHGMVASQGILTSRGGMTCHAAVVARGMGIPCVAGCEAAIVDVIKKELRIGERIFGEKSVITIDGGNGSVIGSEVQMVDPSLGDEAKLLLEWADSYRKLGVRANADTPEAAARAREFGAQGIGLCRTERMFNAQDRLPIVQQMILSETFEERKKALERLLPMQKGDFKEIFKAMSGLPVTIRLLDPPLHEFLPKLEDILVEVTKLSFHKGDEKVIREKEALLKKVRALTEFNPMLGHRGCRLGITHPEIYEMQARAVFEAALEVAKEGADVKLEIMLPLVGNVNEMKFLKERVKGVAKETMKEYGLKIGYLIGTMIEVPRAALTADEIAREADFFSFGTNDLTQTGLGFSRDDAEAKFIHVYLDKKIMDSNPFEVLDFKGIGKLIEIAVKLGRRAKRKLKIGICGEAGGEPSSIEFFHKAKLDYVSCSGFRVPIARLAAAQAALKDKVVEEKKND